MLAASITAHREELVRNQIGIKRKPIFVGIRVVILNGREIYYLAVFASDVLVCMPDTTGDAEELAAVLTEINLQNHAERRRFMTRVEKNHLHFSLQEAIAVFVLLVHRPAFDDAGTDRVEISEYQRVGMPLPSWIKHLADGAPVIGVQNQIAHTDSIDHDCTRFPVWSDKLPIPLACLFESLRMVGEHDGTTRV